MRRYVFILICLIASLLCLSSCSRLYPLSLKEFPTDWGSSVWILDYSLDGQIYSGVFDTHEEAVKYYGWLKRGRRVEGGIDD